MPTTTAATIPPGLKGLLFLLAGLGAGFAACWFTAVAPARADEDRVATLLGPGAGVEASPIARLESGIRSLQGERNAGQEAARRLEAELATLRSAADEANKERATRRAELETSRASEARLTAELSACKEALQAAEAGLAQARTDLEAAEQRCARTAAERDAFEQSMQALQALVDPAPLQLAPLEAGWHGTPSTLAREAQSGEVLAALSPLLAKGHHQPLQPETSEPQPFSLRALEASGALDRSNAESLFILWSLVAERANDRADKWPSAWAASDAPGWLDDWYRTHQDHAVPVLDRAQRFLIELGPMLVGLRLLAP